MKQASIKYRIPLHVALHHTHDEGARPFWGDGEYYLDLVELNQVVLADCAWALRSEDPIVIYSTSNVTLDALIEAAHAMYERRLEGIEHRADVTRRVRAWVHEQGDAVMERALSEHYNVLAGLLERCANEFGNYMKAVVYIEDKDSGHSYPWSYYTTRLPMADDFKLYDDVKDAVDRLIVPPGISIEVKQISNVRYTGASVRGRAVPVVFSADIDGCPEFTVLVCSSLHMSDK